VIESESCVRGEGRTSGMAIEVWNPVQEQPPIIRVGLGPVLFYTEGAV